MNNATQELMKTVGIFIEFRENILKIKKDLQQTQEDIEFNRVLYVLKEHVELEIRKTIKDIISIERM